MLDRRHSGAYGPGRFGRRGRMTRLRAFAAVACLAIPGVAPRAPAHAASPSTMAPARAFHTATRLSDGRVLIAGGFSGWETAELYNPTTNAWTAAASMGTARLEHT